ncbi:uncharacterized protein NEMAJ01_0811 [Nematocida major]|uniref:uncharacterized protein n=1 Tax=Nematocida major TaxID=1912982 RepID=UPI00200895C5|nr:uncharacterized protein NEMAJ01_0811 [Nematocida major]KAH9385915.1 hypothetical protein NEMAJ01_0811 [Nematocida major]
MRAYKTKAEKRKEKRESRSRKEKAEAEKRKQKREKTAQSKKQALFHAETFLPPKSASAASEEKINRAEFNLSCQKVGFAFSWENSPNFCLLPRGLADADRSPAARTSR